MISDVHANPYALEAVERDAGRTDLICCAGDIVDYGTDPHAAIAWIREHDVRCVQGNHDRHLLNVMDVQGMEEARKKGTWQWVHDNIECMTPEDMAWLRALPEHIRFEADGIGYVLQHQMREGSYDMPESLQAFEKCWQDRHGMETAEKRMIFGHTHRRCVHMLDERHLWLNPGSVSYRRMDDDDKRAHYMIIEDGKIMFRAVAYDRSRLLERVLEYERLGNMMPDQIQVAKFFFGD